jgi:uncharacterized membrane protein
MAKKRLEVMAAVYEDQERARTILDMLQQMHRASTITLADSTMVTKNEQGKLEIKETREVTTRKGAKRGAVITGCLAIIYPPSLIASLLLGGTLGGLWGRLRDTGIKTGDMKEIAANIEPGKAAVFALAEPEHVPAIERALEGYDGRIIRHGTAAPPAPMAPAPAGEGGTSEQAAGSEGGSETGQAPTGS